MTGPRLDQALVRAETRVTAWRRSPGFGSNEFIRYRPGMEPSACRLCGDNRGHHGRAYYSGVGTHSWVMPTPNQILYRMLRRRYDPRRWQR